jgi:colicin import membrane protein
LALEAEAERTKAAGQEQLARINATRRQIAALRQLRQVREARVAAQAWRVAEEVQRVAQLAEAERARLEDARLALRRATETRRLMQKLARVHQLRAARLADQARRREAENRIAARAQAPSPQVAEAPPAAVAAPVAPPASPPSGRAALGGEPDGRLTVLLVMAPGTYGIRRNTVTADPVLCALDGCYVSTGASTAATFMPGYKALGVGNTLGGRAGACRHSLGCVFRGVEIRFPAALQPVDLHILKHDRRRPQLVNADSDCRLAAGRLTCARPVYAENYILWVLPDWLAAAAGPDALERTMREGLTLSRSAEGGSHTVK